MRDAGKFLILSAVFLRTAVVLGDESEFWVVIALQAVYGLLLVGETWWEQRTPLHQGKSPKRQITYLFAQSVLVIGALITSSYEDFLAVLFIPLSLDAVSFFGKRLGFVSIAAFSVAMICTFLFSDAGPLFGIAMGVLYSGLCFLFGGYAHQVQKAEEARNQNQQMYNELQTAHDRLRGSAEQMANLAVEQERNRLARDLHDSVTQTIFSMNLTAQSAQVLLAKEPSRVVEQLFHLEELAASAQREIQSLVLQLSPVSILEADLPTALHRLAAEQKARNGLEVSLEIQVGERVSRAVATGLYSIAQEALTNVAKHSGSCEATVRLNIKKNCSYLEIEDGGAGFDPQAVFNQRGHLGLAGMSERAGEMGWFLSIDSRPGRGTRIRLRENSTGGPL